MPVEYPTSFRIISKEHTSLGGSNPAWILRGQEGEAYYTKEYSDSDQARCEWVANQIYRACGTPVLDGSLITMQGKLLYATPLLPPTYKHFRWDFNRRSETYAVYERVIAGEPVELSKYRQEALGKIFIPACLLLDWDAVGTGDKPLGNLLLLDNERLVLIDHGGALLFRGLQGKKPKSSLNADVTELDILRDPHGINALSAAVFDQMDPEFPRDGALTLVHDLTDDKIAAIVSAANFSPAIQHQLITLLCERRSTIIQKILGPLYQENADFSTRELMPVRGLHEYSKVEVIPNELPWTPERFYSFYRISPRELPVALAQVARNIIGGARSGLNRQERYVVELDVLYRLWEATRSEEMIAAEYHDLLPIAKLLDSDVTFFAYLRALDPKFDSKAESAFYTMVNYVQRITHSKRRYQPTGRGRLRTHLAEPPAWEAVTIRDGRELAVIDRNVLELARAYKADEQLLRLIFNRDNPRDPRYNILFHETNTGSLPSIGRVGEISSAYRAVQVHGERLVAGEHIHSRGENVPDVVFASRGRIGYGHTLLTWFDRFPAIFAISEPKQEATLRQALETGGIPTGDIDVTVETMLRRNNRVVFIGAGPRSYDNLLGSAVPLTNCEALVVNYEYLEEARQWAQAHAPHLAIVCLEAVNYLYDSR